MVTTNKYTTNIQLITNNGKYVGHCKYAAEMQNGEAGRQYRRNGNTKKMHVSIVSIVSLRAIKAGKIKKLTKLTKLTKQIFIQAA